MNDADNVDALHGVERAASYRSDAAPATHSLHLALETRADESGSLSFQDFMQLALYHPEFGYYSRAPHIGREGDFYTSVSVGPLFGSLLARRFAEWWQQSDRPIHWRLIECGAHDGTLAADLLNALKTNHRDAFNSVEYVISEPLPRLQTIQRETLKEHRTALRWVDDFQELVMDPQPTVVFGNELIDALPVTVLAVRGGRWLEQRVTSVSPGQWQWVDGGEVEAPGLPAASVLPEGYRTEVRLGLAEFLRPLRQIMSRGLMVWIDYGFAAPEYYSPDRSDGTLRTYLQHHAGSNPLENVGESDITAHVDFTALAQAAQTLGFDLAAFRSQGSWLTGLARDWLLQRDGNLTAKDQRAFQTLTHPAHLGAKFHVIELAWNDPAAVLASPMEFERLALDFRSP